MRSKIQRSIDSEWSRGLVIVKSCGFEMLHSRKAKNNDPDVLIVQLHRFSDLFFIFVSLRGAGVHRDPHPLIVSALSS